MPIKSTLLAAAFVCASLCTQAQYQVLVAETCKYTTSSQLNLSDSIIYKHSNGRRSTVLKGNPFYGDNANLQNTRHFNGYKHDSSFHYTFSTETPATLKGHTVQTYDADGDLAGNTYVNIPWKGYEHSSRASYSYTTINAQKVVSVILGETYNPITASWENSTRTTNRYDANTRCVEFVTETAASPTGWSVTSIDSFVYDARGNRVRTNHWAQDATSGIWALISYSTAGYDANNRIMADTSGSQWIQYIYKFNGKLEERNIYSLAINGYRDKYEYKYDMPGKLIAINSKLTNPGGANYSRTDSFTYNAFNNCVKHSYQSTAHPIDGYTVHYYYAAVWPSRIAQAASNALQLSLYPSPAVNSINISLTLKTAQDINAAITSADGRLIKRWIDNKTQQYSKNISVMDLAAGTYYLTITAGGERLQKSFVVVR